MSGEDGYRYIDIDQINEDIESGKAKPVRDAPTEVLFGTIVDLLNLAQAEGMSEEEIDEVLRRLADYQAEHHRKKFRLRTNW